MFYLTYLHRELRRRMGRTVLTVLGLAVGVSLVVTVSALSSGLDKAQGKILDPLAKVGTDLVISRPIDVPLAGSGASAS
ncbi:MAG: ABC transporter permease, partial [Acidimicrobiales bacterium]|nr:ABC transporter permease [Acidimicrobiales bacterium]